MNSKLLEKYNKKMPLNVLIFPGGTENGLEIMRSLSYCKEFSIFSVSNRSINHAPFVYQRHFEISNITSSTWVSELNNIIQSQKIDLIFPANSLVIDALLENAERIGCEIVLPPKDIVELTRSKKSTIERLKDVIATPAVLQYESVAEAHLPVFIKPDKGYGSQGADIVNTADQLLKYKAEYQKFIIQEYLDGAEYSVDCFSSTDGKLMFASGRERIRIRMGTSMHAEDLSAELEAEVNNIAQAISLELKIPGLWFFQLKKDKNGKLKLLEVDIRVAGTMCFNRCRGVNFPKLSLLQHIGLSVSILKNDFKFVLDRSLANRYKIDLDYDHVYVDLDDTLIVNKKLNVQLVGFLYQAISKGKKIHLISKSLESDKEAYLKSWKIHQIFDELIWLKETDMKSSYITEKKSIFIDDSFSQRKEVADRCGISTFDPTMIEVLLDERI